MDEKTVDRIFAGCLNDLPPVSSKIVRIFTSSTFTDMLMERNKKPPELPEDETYRPFECICMDGFQTAAGEHGLAIVDRHTGFTWCKKTGDMRTGTASVIKNILFEVLGPA